MRHPNLAIFDIDGTIIDHEKASRIALEEVRTHVVEFSNLKFQELSNLWASDFSRLWKDVINGRSSIEANRIQRFGSILEKTGHGRLRDVAIKAAALYGETYDDHISAVDGALELLRTVKDLKIPIALLTNNISKNQKAKLEKAGLSELYDFMLTPEETGLTKPDREIFNSVLREFGCAPNSAVMVGNSFEEDVAGAYQSGIKPVWFNRFGYQKPDTSIQFAEISTYIPVDDALKTIFSGF